MIFLLLFIVLPIVIGLDVFLFGGHITAFVIGAGVWIAGLALVAVIVYKVLDYLGIIGSNNRKYEEPPEAQPFSMPQEIRDGNNNVWYLQNQGGDFSTYYDQYGHTENIHHHTVNSNYANGDSGNSYHW